MELDPVFHENCDSFEEESKSKKHIFFQFSRGSASPQFCRGSVHPLFVKHTPVLSF